MRMSTKLCCSCTLVLPTLHLLPCHICLPSSTHVQLTVVLDLPAALPKYVSMNEDAVSVFISSGRSMFTTRSSHAIDRWRHRKTAVHHALYSSRLWRRGAWKHPVVSVSNVTAPIQRPSTIGHGSGVAGRRGCPRRRAGDTSAAVVLTQCLVTEPKLTLRQNSAVSSRRRGKVVRPPR